ncbi:hypothetical protein N9J88_02455 [Porticoccaceae bacterium]|nr:hypothetical protein [Porticoccaceae bacterium]
MSVPVVTGTIPKSYEIVDSIFALDSHQESFLWVQLTLVKPSMA